MKVQLNKGNTQIVRALRKRGMFGLSDREVANALLQRAVYDLITTDYVRKLHEFTKSLREEQKK